VVQCGRVDLKGLPLLQRFKALIGIAQPEIWEGLTKQAIDHFSPR
jgi:acyl-CoA hydrolase